MTGAVQGAEPHRRKVAENCLRDRCAETGAQRVRSGSDAGQVAHEQGRRRDKHTREALGIQVQQPHQPLHLLLCAFSLPFCSSASGMRSARERVCADRQAAWRRQHARRGPPHHDGHLRQR